MKNRDEDNTENTIEQVFIKIFYKKSIKYRIYYAFKPTSNNY